MSRSSFEDLEVFQLAERLCDTIWEIVSQWTYFDKDTVGKQIIRASDSIGANIVEGIGRWSHQDNKRFVRIARGSLYETKFWLRRAYQRNLLREEDVSSLKKIIDELLPRLSAYHNSIGK